MGAIGQMGQSWLGPGLDLDPNLDVWDWKTKHLARKVLQKSAFAEIGFLMIPGSIFHDGLRTNFHDFCCPGDWLEI